MKPISIGLSLEMTANILSRWQQGQKAAVNATVNLIPDPLLAKQNFIPPVRFGNFEDVVRWSPEHGISQNNQINPLSVMSSDLDGDKDVGVVDIGLSSREKVIHELTRILTELLDATEEIKHTDIEEYRRVSTYGSAVVRYLIDRGYVFHDPSNSTYPKEKSLLKYAAIHVVIGSTIVPEMKVEFVDLPGEDSVINVIKILFGKHLKDE